MANRQAESRGGGNNTMTTHRWPSVCPVCASRKIFTYQADGTWWCSACGSDTDSTVEDDKGLEPLEPTALEIIPPTDSAPDSSGYSPAK
jgi:hypothetical protein